MDFRPIEQLPYHDWNESPRSFGSLRAGGLREHAGCDIYAPVETPVYAIRRGQVIRPIHLFYKDTFDIEIHHNNFIVRYCELGLVNHALTMGAYIDGGELIGYVGKIDGLDFSMLHIEFYTGSAEGPLTNLKNPPYMRRKDLFNGTNLLNNIYGIKSKGNSL